MIIELLAAAILTLAAPAASEVTVTDLDLDPRRWNGATVTVEGELIGDYSVRASSVWVQLNDDPYARAPLLESGRPAGPNVGIGVRMPPELYDPDHWGPPGRFGVRGPIVGVTGTFHHNDPRSGETFIEAVDVTVLEPARTLDRPVPTTRIVLGLIALAAGGVISLLALRRRPRPS